MGSFVNAGQHRYFLHAGISSDGSVQEVAGPEQSPAVPGEVRYQFDLLRHAIPRLKAQGLHFYFTREPAYLPEYGSHVVSMLTLEERTKVPVYGRHVLAVLRSTRSQPFFAPRLHMRMGHADAVIALEFARDWMLHLKSLRAQAKPPSDWPSPVREAMYGAQLPIGYYSRQDVAYIPPRDRPLDLFFAGEVRHPLGQRDYARWTSTGKFEVREQLLRELRRLEQEGRWKIDLTSGEMSANKRNAAVFNSYCEKMMNTRICVAPRGTMAETYRHYEGLMAGCLVVSNRLPDEPFLAGAPFVIVDHWSQLGSILKKYGRDNDYLQEMSDRARVWFAETVATSVIGLQVADHLNEAAHGLYAAKSA